MNAKWKIITAVMLVISAFCLSFIAVFISHSTKHLEEFTVIYADGVRGVVSTLQEQTGKQYQRRIKSFLESGVRGDMKKAVADRDREELIRLTTPYFEMFKKEDPYFATLTWILPDNTAFLHMHDINKPAKDISKVRPDIVTVNKTHQQYAGFANSASGMQYRIVHPVSYDGKHVGVLHFGLKVEQFIDAVQEKLQLPVGIVLRSEQYDWIANSTMPGMAGASFAILTPQLELFEDNFSSIHWDLAKQRIILHDKDHIILKAVSLDNYTEESQGHIFVALDISEKISKMRSDLLVILFLVALLLILSFLIVYFGYDSLSQKVLDLQIVEKVNDELETKVLERTRELQENKNFLKQSEKKYRTLIEDLNDWVWEVDENGVYIYASPTVTQLLGFSPDEMLGKTPFDFMEPAEAERVGEIIKHYSEKHSAFKNIINSNLHKNGQKVVLESSGKAIIDEDGIFRGYRGVDRDITQRQQAEETLQAEKERLNVTLRSIGDGVITTDVEGNVLFLNNVAEKLTGWSVEQAEGKLSTEVFNIINEKTGEKCISPVQRVMDLGRIIGLANHTALIARDGTIRSIADSGAPIRNRKSEIIGVVLVFRDVTHEKKTEEELIKIRKLESVGVLAGGIAHDFNNILSAILGNIDLAGLRIGEKDKETAALLADARKATKRATKLTGQLLTFSKGGEPIKKEISLITLVTESADFVIHGSNVSCRYHFPDDLWMIDADSGQIGQVIQNVIINAKQAMPEGGIVDIQCANVQDAAVEAFLSVDKGNFVSITVRDSGVGIPKEIIDKIFDPYFTTKQAGSGLGLAICHSIVNKHDGHITVDSKPGSGTTFTLYLPAIHSTAAADLLEQPMPVPQSLKAIRVMIMDDEQMLRNVARSQLLALGHEPILVSDGSQAINKYQQMQDVGTPVDLVIMDLTIPGGMGGQEAAEKLLQIDPDAKLIVASGYSNDPIMADCEKYGFRAAVAKPFDLKQLNDAIVAAGR